MKNIIVFFLVFFLLGLSSCSKNEDFTAAEVEKNCTGTYLKFDDKFYQVCNYELLAKKNSGDKMNVSIKHLDKCENEYEYLCYMAFPNEGFIEIRYQY